MTAKRESPVLKDATFERDVELSARATVAEGARARGIGECTKAATKMLRNRASGPRSLGLLYAVLLLVGLARAWVPQAARADRPRDYMFAIPEDGSRFIVDYFLTGLQLSLENTQSYFGKANTLRLRGTALASYPLAQVEGRADFRILFLELGLSAGYRSVYRNLQFEPGKDGEYCLSCGRKGRRAVDPLLGKAESTDRFPFVEGRLQLLLPFNDHIAAVGLLASRYESRKDRSFDWFYTDVHDHGWAQRAELTVFFKHRDWGGIGPYVQYLRLPRAGDHESGWALGFNALTRLGLVDYDDMLFVTFLVRPGDRSYGQHSYYSPIRALVAYRLHITL